jgi:hypothetical protein
VPIVVDIQTASIAIASASVVVGVVYYALQLRNQNRMRQTDLLMRLYAIFTSREFEEAWYKVLCLEFKDYEKRALSFFPETCLLQNSLRGYVLRVSLGL